MLKTIYLLSLSIVLVACDLNRQPTESIQVEKRYEFQLAEQEATLYRYDTETGAVIAQSLQLGQNIQVFQPNRDGNSKYAFKLAENDSVLYRFDLVTGAVDVKLIARDQGAQIFPPDPAIKK